MATTGLNEVLSLGRDTEFSVIGTRSVPTEDIPQLDGFMSETSHWLEVSGIRTLPDDAMPFSVNRVYVPARYAGIEPLLKTGQTSVFRAIEHSFDVSVGRVSQTTRAISCPPDEAKILGLPDGAPALMIEAQVYLSNGTLMEISLATFDPDRFQLRTDVEFG